MSWDPVPFAERNGIIRSYTVTLYNLESGMTANISSNSTSLMITELHPYYEYKAKVKAETILYGPYSVSVAVLLNEEGLSWSCCINHI